MSEACGFLNAMEHANKLSLQGWSQHGRFQNASCDYCNSCLSDKYFLLIKKSLISYGFD